MEELGESLCSLAKKQSNGMFSLKTVSMIGIELVIY